VEYFPLFIEKIQSLHVVDLSAIRWRCAKKPNPAT